MSREFLIFEHRSAVYTPVNEQRSAENQEFSTKIVELSHALIMNRQLGYTLIEILIALAVFAFLASITSSILYQTFKTKAQLSKHSKHLNRLQLAITLIERDTAQAIERPVRGDEMHIFPAFIGQARYFELTRTGFNNPYAEEKRSSLKRIAYLCDNKRLIRRSWPTLDSIERNQYEDNNLLTNLEDCKFAYLNHNLQVLPEWFANALQQDQPKKSFPKAIQLSLTLKNWGKMNLLFRVR